jgi:hypothetical protein
MGTSSGRRPEPSRPWTNSSDMKELIGRVALYGLICRTAASRVMLAGLIVMRSSLRSLIGRQMFASQCARVSSRYQ